MPRDLEIGPFQKLHDIETVSDAPSGDFGGHRLVNGCQDRFAVLAEPLGNVHGMPPGRVIRAAETMPDIHHSFPCVESVMVFEPVVNDDFLAGAQLSFDYRYMVVVPDFAGLRVLFIGVPDNQNIEGVRLQTAPDEGRKFVQNAGLVGGGNCFLKAEGHGAIGLGKPGRLNQAAGLPGVAPQNLGGWVGHLIFNRGLPASEGFENHYRLLRSV